MNNSGVTLGKFAALIPTSFLSSFAKIAKTSLNEKMTNKIISEGLYHLTPDENTAQKILDSGYVKASKQVNVNYGLKDWTFFFAGCPDVENYIKNMVNSLSDKTNPLIYPDIVVDAVKLNVNKNDMSNYRCRSLNDEVIIYQGSCVLPHKAVEKVKLVLDLVRDENGNPIKNNKGIYNLAFREATKEELNLDTNTYKPKSDYLKFVEQVSRSRGYKENRNVWNSFNTLLEIGIIEGKHSINGIRNNYKDIFKTIKNNIFNKFSKKNIAPSVEEVLGSYNQSKKNPNLNEKYVKKIAELQNEGFVQEDLKDLIGNFSHSREGAYFSQKYRDIEENITRKGIHGKNHADRVAITAMMIAQKEQIFESNDIRYIDILSTAAMYHDIGRGLDFGPHAANSARKIKKMDLKYMYGKSYSDLDKKMVMALVESHEGTPEKIEKMIKKYNIIDSKDQEVIRKMNSIIRDADALDRVRLDISVGAKYIVNLDANYLVTNSAKSMIKSAYQLESAQKTLGNMYSIIDYNLDENQVADINKIKNAKGIKELDHKTFDERVRVDLSELKQVPVKNNSEIKERQSENLER